MSKVGDKKPQLEYHDAKALMAHGPAVLHDDLAVKLETALGRSLPQMEVRVTNLSIHAEFAVSGDRDAKSELPTIANILKKGFTNVGAKKRVVKKQILHKVNSVFKPGTMTLVLGQPGSGKSSLMKVLSGRFPQGKNVRIDGEMTYNGTPQHELTKRLPQFVPSRLPSLTMRVKPCLVSMISIMPCQTHPPRSFSRGVLSRSVRCSVLIDAIAISCLLRCVRENSF